MTVTLYKLSIIGVALVLLVGCSYKAKVENQSALERCNPVAGSPYNYRKSILVAGTTAAHDDVARDLPGLANLTSRRLQTHLDALERFKVLAVHDVRFESMALQTAARVSQFGRQYASQFVVKLELQDLTMHSSGGWLSELFGGGTQRNVLIKLFGGGTQRNVLIKLNIYDAEYGVLFHSQRYQGTVSGDVVGYPGTSSTVTASWFSATLGTKIDEMLKAMSMQINEKLACVPFSTEVTAVMGEEIHINAGYLHNIRPGETLRIYRRNEIWPPDGTTHKQEKRGGWIRVNTVFPNRSIAGSTEDDVGDNSLVAGDVVRAW